MQKIPEEVHNSINNEIYNQQGDRWWQTDFSLNLIKPIFNPVRVGYSKKILERLKIIPEGKSALEVGCGGGILTEEISCLGFSTTGIDPSLKSITTASEHAIVNGLKINYINGTGEALPFPDSTFDIVFCCDVLEHVQHLGKVISEISRVLKPGGVFIYDTFNRTFLSNLIAIKVLQDWKRWAIMPPHLHEWKMFIKPGEMKRLLSQNQLTWKEHIGIMPDISVLRIWRYLYLRAKGYLNYDEFGQKFRMTESPLTNVMYMGYAIKNELT
jgi:2-polyprenyl-6-hydroxyphenyl methylase / 3-demethylubiquinone-9 3-methyltransferase